MTHRLRERDQRKQSAPKAPEQVSAPTGVPLTPAVADASEARFGHSFADVRVHDDAAGDRVARHHDARALAVGDDLFFREGAYAPESPFGARVLAHELAHVVQQSPEATPLAPSEDVGRTDAAPGGVRDDSLGENAAEQEARAAAEAAANGEPASVSPGSVAAGTPQAWPWDDEKPPGDPAAAPSSGGGLLDSVGSLASGAWDATKGAAGSVYDGYQKSTNFTALQKGDAKAADAAKGQFGEGFIRGGLNGAIDDAEALSKKGNDKMVADAEGHWYSGLAQGAAWMNNTSTSVTGGLLKGVGDIGFGMANAIAHPIDAAGGLLGIAEHDLPMVGSVLKAGHGLVDLGLDAAGVHYQGQGQYGKSFGELGNHLFNPLQQMEDDQKFNSNLAQGIVDPDHKGWQGFKDKPVESVTRALTNIAPIALGVGEAAGEGASEAANAAPKGPVGEPPTLRTPFAPDGVPAPKPFNPDIPTVGPGDIPAPSSTPSAPPSSVVPDVPSPFTKPSPGVLPAPFDLPAFPESPTTIPPDSFPGFGIIDDPLPSSSSPSSPRVSVPDAPVAVDSPPPGSAPKPISQLDPALGPTPEQGPATQRSPGVSDPSSTPSSLAPDSPSAPQSVVDAPPSSAVEPGGNGPGTQRSPQRPPGVPEPTPFDPDIQGPTSGDIFPNEPGAGAGNGPTTARPTSSRSDIPFLDRGDPFSIPPGFEGQQLPFPARQTPSLLPPPSEIAPTQPAGVSPSAGPSASSSVGPSSSFPEVPAFPSSEFPAGPRVINPGGGEVVINPTAPLFPDAGAPTVRAPEVSVPSQSPPVLTERGVGGPVPNGASFPGLGAPEPPHVLTERGLGAPVGGPLPDPISNFDLAFGDPAPAPPVRRPGVPLPGPEGEVVPSSVDSPISPRQPPPTPTIEELLEGLMKRQGENPFVSLAPDTPSPSSLLRGLF